MKSYASGDLTDFHRVFSRAPWEPSDLAKVLILMILDWMPDDWIKVAMDDTTVLHKGKNVYGKGCHRDAARSTDSMTTYQYGHKPLHSWRVLLLPYLGEQELYDKIRLDQPWDSEHNHQFHDAALDVYQCRSNPNISPGETGYTVIVGRNTAFSDDGQGKRLDDFGPNRRNLLLLAERVQPVCWMDPTSELTEAIAKEGINQRPRNRPRSEMTGMGSMHPGGMNAGFAGGGVQFISKTMKDQHPKAYEGMLDGTAETIE